MAAIVVSGLRKSYGDVEAVAGIDFAVEEGEVLAMLGPNGAGKTTAVEILEGYRTPDAGSVSVLGLDPTAGGRAFRDRIGIVLQSSGIDLELSVTEAIALYRSYYSRQRSTAEVVELVGLTEKSGARIKTLSGGQRRRLDLAIAIVGDPNLIFLDEPTTGFDPSARRHAWTLVDELRRLGKTILLTTHYLDEAQRLADRVVVLNRGRIVAEGEPGSLGGRDTAAAVISFRLPDGMDVSELPTTGSLDGDGLVQLSSNEPTRTLHTLTSWAIERNIELTALQVNRPSLEDVYLELTEDATPATSEVAR